MSEELHLPVTVGMIEDWVREQDDRDFLLKTDRVFNVNLGLSEYAVKLLAEGKLPVCGLCSDDLSTVCSAHDLLLRFPHK